MNLVTKNGPATWLTFYKEPCFIFSFIFLKDSLSIAVLLIG